MWSIRKFIKSGNLILKLLDGAAKAIDWVKEPTFALNAANDPLFEWYTDAKVNTCYNALDRHVQNGRADQTAIIYDSPMTNTKTHISYAKLLEQTALLSGALIAKELRGGPRHNIYAHDTRNDCSYACLHEDRSDNSVVFGGFAANELAVG